MDSREGTPTSCGTGIVSGSFVHSLGIIIGLIRIVTSCGTGVVSGPFIYIESILTSIIWIPTCCRTGIVSGPFIYVLSIPKSVFGLQAGDSAGCGAGTCLGRNKKGLFRRRVHQKKATPRQTESRSEEAPAKRLQVFRVSTGKNI